MLLGAYYMILDSTWDKLIDISEFVEDAEVRTGVLAALESQNSQLWTKYDSLI